MQRRKHGQDCGRVWQHGMPEVDIDSARTVISTNPSRDMMTSAVRSYMRLAPYLRATDACPLRAHCVLTARSCAWLGSWCSAWLGSGAKGSGDQTQQCSLCEAVLM